MIQEKAVECRRSRQIMKAEHCEFHVQSKHLTGKLSRWTPLYRREKLESKRLAIQQVGRQHWNQIKVTPRTFLNQDLGNLPFPTY